MHRILSPQRLANIVSPLVRIWSKSLRYERINYEQVKSTREKEAVIFALWHDELFAPCYLHRDEGVIAVVSASRDGEFLSKVLENLGYNLARGSSNREGLRALRSAYKTMLSLQRDAVLTIDGPKGPRHRAKAGIFYLSHKANAPIVPTRVQITHKKIFSKAWDNFQLPLPGSKCKIIYGSPYRLSCEKLDSKLVGREQLVLEEKMEQVYKSIQ